MGGGVNVGQVATALAMLGHTRTSTSYLNRTNRQTPTRTPALPEQAQKDSEARWSALPPSLVQQQAALDMMSVTPIVEIHLNQLQDLSRCRDASCRDFGGRRWCSEQKLSYCAIHAYQHFLCLHRQAIRRAIVHGSPPSPTTPRTPCQHSHSPSDASTNSVCRTPSTLHTPTHTKPVITMRSNSPPHLFQRTTPYSSSSFS
jgi:hypothetical protein